MKNRICSWAAPAQRVASACIAGLLAVSMLFYGAPFALVGGALGGSRPSVAEAFAEESSQKESWASQIDAMLAEGPYVEGEAIVIVAPAAEAAVASAQADGNCAVSGEQSQVVSLLDSAETEELSQTTGDTYESAFSAALPDAALAGTQLAAAAETGELAAVQASDVEVYTLLIRQDGMTTREILEALASDERVLWAEPNCTATLTDEDDEATAAQAASIVAEGSGAASAAAQAGGGTQTASGAGSVGTTVSDSEGNPFAGDQAEGVTPVASSIAGEDDLADGSAYQWAYAAGEGSAYGSYADGYDVNLDGWNDASAANADGVIAIVDTGIDHENPDLSDVMFDMTPYLEEVGGDQYGCNVTGDGGDSCDVVGHGTHCAGIAAAAWNGYGVSGAANGAKLLSVRMVEADESISRDSTIKAFSYIERAVDAGVDIRVASNSWCGTEGSRALYLAVEAVGKKGVAVVFASGNDRQDIDLSAGTSKTVSASDYVTVVDSALMTGAASSFSNYGEVSTDLYAPGSVILSTAISQKEHFNGAFLPALLKEGSLAAFGDFSEGSSEIQAWTGIAQIDGDSGSVAKKKVGTVDADAVGFDPKGGVLRISYEELAEASGETGSNNLLISLKVPVDKDKTDQLSNAFAAVAFDGGGSSEALGYSSLMLSTVNAEGKTSLTPTRAGFGFPEAGWGTLSVSTETALSGMDTGNQLAVYTDEDGQAYTWMHLLVPTKKPEGSSSTGILIDCVGFGSKLVPYVYMSGTSMATPCVAGLAAVASEQMEGYSSLDKSVRAAELARLLKSSVTEYEQFKGDCTSNGLIDASKFKEGSQRSAAIASATLSEDEESISIEGSFFGDEAGSVTVGGKEAKVKRWSATQVVVERPRGLASGYLTIALTRADGASCSYAQTFVFTKDVSGDEVPVFEETIETPSFFDECSAFNTIAALDGSLYVFGCRYYDNEDVDPSNEQSKALLYNRVWRYQIDSKTWTEVASLPCKLANVSCTLWEGKMLVMGSTSSSNYGGLATKRLFSYDPASDEWTDLSSKVSSDSVPYQASLVNVGDRLLLVGGCVVANLPEDEEAADRQGIWVSAKYDADTARSIAGGDTTLMTLAKDNVREFDLSAGQAFVVGSCQPRANTGLARSETDMQTALVGNKLYVYGGAKLDVSSRTMDEDQYTMECLAVGDDGKVSSEVVGSYVGSDKDRGALPAAFAGYQLYPALAASAAGPILTGLIAVDGSDDDAIIQDDTFLLKDGASAFESIGKRVNYTSTIRDRAIAYRGRLYVLGHDFENGYQTVMRATAVATNELPGDVVSGGGSDQPDEPDGGVQPGSWQSNSEAGNGLAKTGDATVPAAAIALLAGSAAAAVARKAYRKGAVRKL